MSSLPPAPPLSPNRPTEESDQFPVINQHGAKKFTWEPDHLCDVLSGMRDEGLSHQQMLARLARYHDNWNVSINTLRRKLKEYELMGARGTAYTDAEVEAFVTEHYNASNASYDGIRSLQTRMRTRGIMIAR